MKELELAIISELSQSMEIDLHEKRSIEELKLALTDHINYLITHDFNKLMRILYRVDVSEKVLRANLKNNESDAGNVIAGMIIDRQLQKIETKRQFKTNDDIPENEKW
ncbi:MAG: hypothetical protein ACHQF0_17170 [Chitinophagales bacterium]